MALIRGTNGADNKTGTAGGDRILLYDGNDYAFGVQGADEIRGGGGRDTLYGGDGADRLYGDQGFDRLYGGNGADVLNGGSGSDDLVGGAGADRFQYLSLTADDASGGDQFADFILDFSRAEGDRIDLGGIDANPYQSGNQAFRFIGSRDFSGNGAEVRFSRERGPDGGPQTRVQVDADGDRSPDLTLLLTDGWKALDAGDFIL